MLKLIFSRRFTYYDIFAAATIFSLYKYYGFNWWQLLLAIIFCGVIAAIGEKKIGIW